MVRHLVVRLTLEQGVKLIETAPLATSLTRCVCIVLALVLLFSGERAEPIFSFGATPGKLPKTVVPIG